MLVPHPPVVQSTYARLAALSAPLAQRYLEAAAIMREAMPPTDLARWSHYCVQLAQGGWRAWESAETFVGLSPFLAQRLRGTTLWDWAEHGTAMAQRSADVATAFLHAARPFFQQTSAVTFAAWVDGGKWYLQHYPARPALAVEYFRVSPLVYSRFPLEACALWGHLGQDFTRLDASYGQAFLAASRLLLEREPIVDLTPAWEVSRRLLPAMPKVALAYLERYPDLVQRFGAESVTRVHALLLTLPTSATETETFLRQVSATLGLVPASERLHVLDWCQRIASVSLPGMLDFLRHVPALSRRLPGGRLEPWITNGMAIAQQHAEAGLAYFAVESAAAHDCLRTLQTPVVFADVERVLQLYAEGLHGQRLPVKTTAALAPALPAGTSDLPATNGTTIFVPEQVETFPTVEQNFAVYKIAIAHQIGFYECGTFAFSLEAWRQQAPERSQYLASFGGSEIAATATAFERWFACFPQPDLARHLFRILEDARIDAHMARSYKGLRHALHMVMQHSLQQRPAFQNMSLRQILLEGLLQVTLGAAPLTTLPDVVRLLLHTLQQRLQPLLAATATVYDTVSAVVDCYRLMTEIPLQAAALFSHAGTTSLTDLAAQLAADADGIDLAELFRQAGEEAASMPTLPEGTEPAQTTEPVPYRGELKPELIQKQLRLQDLAEELDRLQEALSPMSPEMLKQLLEQGNIDIKSLQEGNLSATSGLFVNDLEGREGGQPEASAARQAELQQEIAALQAELEAAYGNLSSQTQAVLYDEWDYTIGDYRKHWCRLTETVLPEEGTAFVEATRQKYAELLALIAHQFQFLKPEMFKKLKRLIDGEDVDLDSAIEAVVDRRAGNVLSDAVYMRRNKRDRSVAALFLLDMSASTDDEVKESGTAEAARQASKQPPRLFDFSGFLHDDHSAYLPPRPKIQAPRRRIIDVEKEALILMAEALEGLGDAYAVYGFSGYGRDQVDFFIAKEFAERYDARIQGRIAAMKPHRSTRMGVAIRHAIRKLERQDAHLKALLMLSDGYPQDYDYGKDRKSKEYGIQDTMMALHEAHLKGIQTFCITVDPAGHDYLREMCPDANYLVIEDITALPNELPKIYRGLTT